MSGLLGAVLTLLAWPYSTASLDPGAGLDPSWRAALAMAADARMPFGTQIVFTYGPLGFLTVHQLYFGVTTIVAFCFTFVYFSAIFGSLVWVMARAVPVVISLPVAYLVGVVIINVNDGPESVVPLVLAAVVALLSRSTRRPNPPLAWVALGAVVGLFALIKSSVGVGVAALVVIAVVFMGRQWWRAAVLLLTGVVPVFAVSWFATGNGFSNLVPFVRTTVSVVDGYSAAMGLEAGRGHEYWLAAFVLFVVGGFSYSRLHGEARRVQIGGGLAALVAVWVLFKEGFVRHDAHDLVFFAAMPLLLVAFARSRLAKAWLIPSLFGFTIITVVAAGAIPTIVSDPVQSVRYFGHDVATLAASSKRTTVIDQARTSLQRGYGLPPSMTDLMDGATVDVDPWEQSVVWAYPAFRFDPLPVIQDYNAYTTSLDDLDVSYLRSSQAPRFILRQAGASVDYRNPAFDPPATQLAIACHYRQVAVDQGWELLQRAANRCGKPALLGRAVTGFGQTVRVPGAPPGDEVVATFQIHQSLWSSVKATAFKPEPTYMVANGGARTWRFITGTSGDFHVMRPSAALGFDPQFMARSVRSFVFTQLGAQSAERSIDVTFYAVPVRSTS